MKRIIICLVILFLLSVPILGQKTASWRSQGAFVVNASKLIPVFPRTLSEYKSAGVNKDYWGEAFEWNGSIRVFGGDSWTEISDFPHTMNHCSVGMFMIRWRTANSARVTTTVGYGTDNASGGKTGSYGYMYGTNCEEPLFKVSGDSMADIYYELKFWKASP